MKKRENQKAKTHAFEKNKFQFQDINIKSTKAKIKRDEEREASVM